VSAGNFASLASHVTLSVSVSWAMISACGYQIQNPTNSIIENNQNTT